MKTTDKERCEASPGWYTDACGAPVIKRCGQPAEVELRVGLPWGEYCCMPCALALAKKHPNAEYRQIGKKKWLPASQLLATQRLVALPRGERLARAIERRGYADVYNARRWYLYCADQLPVFYTAAEVRSYARQKST